MDVFKDFEIDIYNLGSGIHQFSFKVEKAFFEAYEYSIIKNGNLKVKLDLDNRGSFLALNFSITGTIELICDRSLERFDAPLDLHQMLVLKFGSELIDDGKDIDIIEPGTIRINVADYIYEFITVAVPMKKIHPNYGQETEEEEQLFYTSSDGSDERRRKDINPIWNSLKKLRE